MCFWTRNPKKALEIPYHAYFLRGSVRGGSVVLEVEVEGGGSVGGGSILGGVEVLEVEGFAVEGFPLLLRLLSSACCNLALARLLCLTMRCNRKAISSIVSSSTSSILSICLLIDLYSAILSRIKYINNYLNVYLYK